jgi:hypothetical protein
MGRYPYGFARGLEFADGNAYVGVSRLRNKSTLAQKLLALFNVRCGVLEVDPGTWRIKRGFRLPGSETYELLALPD